VRLIRSTPALCVLAFALASCGGGGGDGGGSTQSSAAAKPPVPLQVAHLPKRTTAASITVGGTSSPGAEITVAGKPVLLQGNSFHTRVSLKRGKNTILVEAAKFGTSPTHASIHIRRVDPEPATPPPATAGSPGSGDGNPCPPGQEPVTHMGPTHCGKLTPANPSQCPPGQVPVGSTGACGPPQDTPPDQGSGGGGGDQGQGGGSSGGDQGQGSP
jgi:hypothetical protein